MNKNKESTFGTSIQSVDRALLILDLLQEKPEGMGVTELANKMDVAKSTVHRMLTSLQKKKYVMKMSDKYMLGLKCLEIGEAMSARLDIRTTASPILEALSKRTKETVHLVTMDEGEVVYIDKKESEAVIRMFSQIGKRAPVYCTGVGKAILAFYPEKQIEAILDRYPMKRFTKNTITTKKQMMPHLAAIRKKGWALDDEEHEEGIRCAAAPIFNRTEEIEAAISIAVPMIRVKNKEFNSYIEEIKTAAQEISKAMGSKGSS